MAPSRRGERGSTRGEVDSRRGIPLATDARAVFRGGRIFVNSAEKSRMTFCSSAIFPEDPSEELQRRKNCGSERHEMSLTPR